MRHFLAASALALTLSTPVLAQPITVRVDQQPLDAHALMEGGRVLVPLRGIFERLGAKVHYSADTHAITAHRGEREVRLTLGSPEATIDGRPVHLDVPAQSLDERTMVPLRFVSEAMGAEVHWTEATRTVEVTSGGQASPAPAPPRPAPPRPAPPRPAVRFAPAPGSQVTLLRPTVQATFSAPVRPDTVRLLLDGHEVTAQARREAKLTRYVPNRDLPPGEHKVHLEAVAADGAIINQDWDFRIAQGAPPAPTGFRLDSPAQGERVGNSLTVRGSAPAGSDLRLTVRPGVGGPRGDSARADRNGHFRLQVRLDGVPHGSPIDVHLEATLRGRPLPPIDREVFRR